MILVRYLQATGSWEVVTPKGYRRSAKSKYGSKKTFGLSENVSMEGEGVII